MRWTHANNEKHNESLHTFYFTQNALHGGRATFAADIKQHKASEQKVGSSSTSQSQKPYQVIPT